MNTIFRGIFLTSNNSAMTAKFYQEVARIALEQVGSDSTYQYWKCDKNGFQLAIHDALKFSDYSFPSNLDSNVTHLYFNIESQDQFLQHLRSLNIEPYSVDDVVVTVVDPDGRKVMFGTA